MRTAGNLTGAKSDPHVTRVCGAMLPLIFIAMHKIDIMIAYSLSALRRHPCLRE
jgi:hypothetical protein